MFSLYFIIAICENFQSNQVEDFVHCNEKLKKLKRNYKGETILHQAAIKGDINSIQRFLLNDCEFERFQKLLVNVKDNAGWTPLHEACLRGHLETAKFLIFSGADINILSNCGTTPLIDASGNGHCDVVHCLLENGADPSVINKRGISALSCAKDDTILESLKVYTRILAGERILENFNTDSIDDIESLHSTLNSSENSLIETHIDDTDSLFAESNLNSEILPDPEFDFSEAKLDRENCSESNSSFDLTIQPSSEDCDLSNRDQSSLSFDSSHWNSDENNHSSPVKQSYLHSLIDHSFLPIRKRYLLYQKDINVLQ